MALDFNALTPTREQSGIIYDAEGVTLVGRFNDELSTYRARKQWTQILSSYFLLEPNRDYEMSILVSAENHYFILNCFFISACGRYAFWRLINDQAPEAASKLGEQCRPAARISNNTIKRRRSGGPGYLSSIWSFGREAHPGSRVNTARAHENANIPSKRPTTTVLSRLRSLLR